MSYQLNEKEVACSASRLLKASGFDPKALDGDLGQEYRARTDDAFLAASAALRRGHWHVMRAQRGTSGDFTSRRRRWRGILTKAAIVPHVGQDHLRARDLWRTDETLCQGPRGGPPGTEGHQGKGGQSNHQFRIAWDVSCLRWAVRLNAMPAGCTPTRDLPGTRCRGLEWGGVEGIIPSRPTYQLASRMREISEIRKRFGKRGVPYHLIADHGPGRTFEALPLSGTQLNARMTEQKTTKRARLSSIFGSQVTQLIARPACAEVASIAKSTRSQGR